MQVNDAYTPQTPIEGVMHAFTRIGRRLKAKQPGDTLDHSAHVVLFALRCNGALRLSDLAGKLELDASTASRHVRSLEQLGLIRRSPDPDDGRAFRVELTEQGIEQWEASARHRMELLNAAMEGWSEEDVQTFERLMTRFADGVAARTEAPSSAAWADKGWAAVAPRLQSAAAERRTEQDSATGSDPAARENNDNNLESTR
ncbi:DNA-binding MarR family transcriptional regulator [Kribbella sp. VKM Ac-2569]|uniref:MarR family winged helix-turn-helix transcriptional regulator n=1 Tax=Kribbella sp. VKM Ac-2569 TaxID=2512220 RepID=UPI00102C215A|nr:MarR family transcriptional regulator [Kribbella sp. VKM Ac-2569]RZT20026.1 DNA-binding MarR family transcriptional regulator [Kribbella sp. VKM Ac-2569]